MTCDETQRHLAGYLGHELDPSTRQAVEAHLASCPTCRAEAAALAGVIRSVGDLPVEEAPRGFADAVMASVRGQAPPTSAWERLFRPRWITLPAYAAAAIMLIGVGWYVFRATPPPPVHVAKQMDDRIESLRETAPPAALESAPAPKRDAAPPEAERVPPPKSAIAPKEQRPSGSGTQVFNLPPAFEPPAARQDLQRESLEPPAIAPAAGAITAADREFTVALNGPRGDEAALARLRAAVERAGGSPLPAAANTADNLWLTISADRLDALQQELDRLPFSSGRLGKGNDLGFAASAPPAAPPAPVTAMSEKAKESAPQVRVKVTIQWAAAPTSK